MRAGEMDRIIVIEREVVTKGTSGGEEKEWIQFIKVSASVRELSGSETFISDQTQAFIRSVFRIYFHSRVTSEMRIIYEGNIYDIQSKKELGRREGLEIIAIAKVE